MLCVISNVQFAYSGELGGLHYVYWDFPLDRFTSLYIDISIINEPDNDDGLYFQMYQGAINGEGFYFGLQTQTWKPGYGSMGKGLIFSRWGTRDLSNVRIVEGGWSQSAGYEGDFVGVRRTYNWTTHDYRLRIALNDTDSVGDWYGVWIFDLHQWTMDLLGSIRFPRVPSNESGIADRGITWTELYWKATPGTAIPTWHVSIAGIYASEQMVAPLAAFSSYSEINHTDIYYDEMKTIHFLMGIDVTRIHPHGNLFEIHEWPSPNSDDGVEGWSNDNTPTFTWSPSADSGSGVAGYYWKVDSGSETWTTSTSVTLPPQSDGYHFFYVKAKDNAGNIGNWGSHDFQIDATPPLAPIVSSPTHPDEEAFYPDNNLILEWAVPSDLSGIAGYSYILDNSPSTISDENINTTANSKFYTEVSSGTWYFHIKGKDNAGNWSPTGHYTTNIGIVPQPRVYEIAYDNEPFEVVVLTNSTILGLSFNESLREINIEVSGSEGTVGFCNITIPNGFIQDLWNGSCYVLIDGFPPLYEAPPLTNGTHTFLYFTYVLSTHKIIIVPEFPFFLIPLLFVISTLLAAIVYRRRTIP